MNIYVINMKMISKIRTITQALAASPTNPDALYAYALFLQTGGQASE